MLRMTNARRMRGSCFDCARDRECGKGNLTRRGELQGALRRRARLPGALAFKGSGGGGLTCPEGLGAEGAEQGDGDGDPDDAAVSGDEGVVDGVADAGVGGFGSSEAGALAVDVLAGRGGEVELRRLLSRAWLNLAERTRPKTAMASRPAMRETALLTPEATSASRVGRDSMTAVVSGATAMAIPMPRTATGGKKLVQ